MIEDYFFMFLTYGLMFFFGYLAGIKTKPPIIVIIPEKKEEVIINEP